MAKASTSTSATPQLGASDVISIMKAAKELGVNQFCWDALQFSLGPQVATPPVAIGTEDPVLAEEAMRQQERETKEQMLSELMISDPEQYEELITQGELDAKADSGT